MNTYKNLFGPDMQQLIEEIKIYTNNELSKQAKYFDETSEYPSELVENLFQRNIFYLLSSNENIDLAVFLEIIRIISTKFASLASILMTQGFYGVVPFYHFGTERQKSNYLSDLLKGNKIGAFGLSEENKDSSSVQTVAQETENGWEINGSKKYISNAPVADVFLIVAKTYKLNGSEGVGIFIVERFNEGLKVSEPMDKLGVKALPVASVTLNQVKVDKDCLLGNELNGDEQIIFIMNLMKLSVSMQAVGISQGSFTKGLDHMSIVRKFGNRLIDNQATEQSMVKLKTNIYSSEAFVRQIILTNPQDTVEMAMVKLLTTDMAVKTTEKMIQLTGGYGYMKESEIERYMRDAKVTAIYAGSSQSQMKIVSQLWMDKN